MSFVLIDASSAIILYKSDLMTLCAREFPLVMAEEVYKEVSVNGYPGAAYFKDVKTKDMIRVHKGNVEEGGPGGMDRGEEETVALFQRRPSVYSFIIIDDGKGARYCHARGIPFINALLVPKIFWYSGRMNTNTYIKMTDRLIGEGRYSRNIIDKAASLLKRDLARFIPYAK